MTAATATVSTVTQTAPDGWDARTVESPGGNVLQGTCWAEHRRSQGARPRFVTFEDGHGALVVTRPARLAPGVLAVARKGPIRGAAPIEHIAAHAQALADLARHEGAIELFADPEVDRSAAYASAMDAAGFAAAPDVQPAIHVMRLTFAERGSAHADPGALLGSFSKSTRQRIRAAQRAGTQVRLDPAGERLAAFGSLLAARARELGFDLHPEAGHLPFIRRLLAAGQARFSVAEHEGELLGGLVAFVQGGGYSTFFSADDAARRHGLPGTMHLVRWEIIRDAWLAGMPSIDLGGVDAAGYRGEPAPGMPTYGLYEHKAGFGAVWVEREPARRAVLRPWADRLSRTTRSLARGTRGLRRPKAAAAAGNGTR